MTISCIVNVIIGFIINIMSQAPFILWSKKNVVIFAILIFLVTIQIVCNIIINSHTNKGRPKKLQKAFQQSGGYNVAAFEIQNCIQMGDLKKCKDIRKMIRMIEK